MKLHNKDTKVASYTIKPANKEALCAMNSQAQLIEKPCDGWKNLKKGAWRSRYTFEYIYYVCFIFALGVRTQGRGYFDAGFAIHSSTGIV